MPATVQSYRTSLLVGAICLISASATGILCNVPDGLSARTYLGPRQACPEMDRRQTQSEMGRAYPEINRQQALWGCVGYHGMPSPVAAIEPKVTGELNFHENCGSMYQIVTLAKDGKKMSGSLLTRWQKGQKKADRFWREYQ
jgi:hypothetical protein